jgi:hypothetical protein
MQFALPLQHQLVGLRIEAELEGGILFVDACKALRDLVLVPLVEWTDGDAASSWLSPGRYSMAALSRCMRVLRPPASTSPYRGVFMSCAA